MFEENDIDFKKISFNQFEELCFDLLMEMGFTDLQWRRGGADHGRDIEGSRLIQNPLGDSYSEKYFFECKHYSKGVPPEELNSKIAWADSEKPKHLVFFISSYLSTGSRDWLKKIEIGKFYKIQVIEEKQLKKLILRYQRIVTKYFSSEIRKLLNETMRAWLVHNLIPEPELLRALAEHDECPRFEVNQIAFVWNCSKHRYKELERNIEDSYPYSVDWMFGMLAMESNSSTPVLENFDSVSLIGSDEEFSMYDVCYNKIFWAEICYNDNETCALALYSLVRDSDGEGIEVVVLKNSDFPCLIRHIPKNAKQELAKVKKLLRCGT